MWIQVDAFKRHLEAYQEATGKTQAQVAKDLGTTYGTLRFWLSGTRPPKRANLEKAAKVFQCSITEFMDDPGAEMQGLDPGDMAKLTAAKRAVMNMVFQRIKPGDVTDEQALAYARILDAAVDSGRIRKEED